MTNGTRPSGKPQLVATYKYRDERGRLLYEVLRYEPKAFKIRRRKKGGGYIWGLGSARRVPYMLPELLEAATDPFGSIVYVVEGEKDCDTLTALGHAASTSKSGPGVFQEEWAQWYAGIEQAIVIADKDAEGRKNALRAHKRLRAAGIACRIVECSRGKDVTDHLGVGGLLRIGAGSGLSDVTLAYTASERAEAGSNGANGRKPSAGVTGASDGKAAACADWALAKLWDDPPNGAAHNGREAVAYKFAQQLRDVDPAVASAAMLMFWRACPQVNSDGEVELYTWEAALDTLASALGSAPSDWTPGVFAGVVMDEAAWDDLTVSFGDMVARKVTWLWKRRFPMGKVCILEGDPDLGKSMVTTEIAARVTRGDHMPDATASECELRDVLIISLEDDPEDTILPRLLAAQANAKRVHTFLLRKDDKGNVIPLTFPEDMPRLRHQIERLKIGLVIVDPITGYLSETIQSHNDASVRRAMSPMAQLAQETGVCILMVRHLNKSGDMKKAKYRGSGSIAFTGAARSVFVVERHPEEPNTVVMAKVKMNLTASDVLSLGYEVFAPDENSAPRIQWTGPVGINADDLLAMPDGRKDAPVREEAVRLLKEILAPGPRRAREVEAIMDEAGISKSTMKRAKTEAGVISEAVHDKATGLVSHVLWKIDGK